MTAYCSVLLSEAAKVHTFSAPVEVHVLLNKRLSVIGSEMYFYEYKSKKKKKYPPEGQVSADTGHEHHSSLSESPSLSVSVSLCLLQLISLATSALRDMLKSVL